MSDNLAPAVLIKRALAAERERDAYKRAKDENDERFMLERDEARAALAAERAAVVAWLRARAVDAHLHAMTINAAYGDRDEWAGAWAALDECTAIADAIERGEHLTPKEPKP